MDVTLDSEFLVHSLDRFGQKHGVGNLANSFSITLGGSEYNGRFLMGSQMNVQIEWHLDGMEELNYKIKNCVVSHGDIELPVIQDECYADVIKANPLEATRSLQGLAYNIFKTSGSEEFTQHINCGVRVCNGQCKRRSDNNGCDNNGPMTYSFREIERN